MNILERLRKLESGFTPKTFNIVTIKHYENESLEDAKNRCEIESGKKILPGEPTYYIDVYSDEQIRERNK